MFTRVLRFVRSGKWASLTGCLLLAAGVQIPAHAQVDIAGLWRPLPRNQDGDGLTLDAAGVPLSEEGRHRLHRWSPAEFDMAEWVCRPHAWDYSLEGPLSPIRFWPEHDRTTQRLIAYHGHINMEGQEATIWMDGRPHPSRYAPHTWSGFTTGEWQGDVLVTTTTHLKEAYIRRWGIMRSDQTTVRTYWRRIGDYLQATVVMYDPLYLTEPYVRSSMMWTHDPMMRMDPYPCEEATETAMPRGTVAHFLPGQNPLPGLDPNVTDVFGTPFEARMGGAETMFPEYIERMRSMPTPPQVVEE